MSSPPPKLRCRTKLLLVVALLAGVSAWLWFDGIARTVNWQAVRDLAAFHPIAARDRILRADRWTRSNAYSQFLLARSSRRLGQFDDVRTYLQRALDLGFPIPQLEREQWLAQAASGQLHEVERYFSGLLTDPQGEGDEICDAFATGFLMANRSVDALRLLDVWQADYPGDPRPYFLRARIASTVQDWKTAEKSYREALAREPRFAPAANGLGDVLLTQNQPAEAVEWFVRAENDAIERPRSLVGQARSLAMQGQSNAARELLEKVLAENPDHPEGLSQLGQIELETGNYAAALPLLERAARAKPRNTEILYAKATALRGAGQVEEARKLLDYVTESRAAKTRADLLTEKIITEPENAEARFEIAQYHLRYGEETEGLMWLKSVLQFAPDHKAAKRALDDFESRRSSKTP